MRKVAKFSKVSKKQFIQDTLDLFTIEEICGEETSLEEAVKFLTDVYDRIELPKRATSGSAGYDFTFPETLFAEKGGAITIPTGIRCEIKDGWFMMIVPRSGIGFKSGAHLANTCGIIDSDYYYSENEGHIKIKYINDSAIAPDSLVFEKNKGIAQAIFMPYGITKDDAATNKRNGGFGSTDSKGEKKDEE